MEKALPTIDNNAPSLFVSARHTDVQCITHLHATTEIVLVTEGTLQMTIGTKEYDIPKGYGAFIEPFCPHAFRSLQKKPMPRADVFPRNGQHLRYLVEKPLRQ